ncbi:hypothetical protein CI109_107407 [Kwoniella shandongensis]|uniref:Mitochondrial carrier protein n=1 Tax=Kwoniella shandongensis TaxID=1734106 RepID=A0AAJ8LRT5_9TREE
MESLVDVTTTSFQAILAVVVVFTAGYAYKGKHVASLSTTLISFSRNVLLPALVLTTFAASPSLTWKRLLQLWPTIIIALVSHVASLIVSLAVQRFSNTPKWTVETLTYNNVASYPLILLYALYHVSSEGGLAHLHWRVRDTSEQVLERATVYILVNLLVVEIARTALSPLIARLVPSEAFSGDDAAEQHDGSADEPTDFEEADERTPLVSPTTSKIVNKRTILLSTVQSPILIAAVIGLVIGIIKPLQRVVVGTGVEDSNGSWLWQGVGLGLVFLGASFALVETLGVGAGVRAGEAHESPEYKVPPTLGTVLLVVLWRYAAIPAIILPIIRGFRHVASTKVYLQDPAFSFVLALTTITPPVLPPSLNPYRSSVLFSTFYVALLSSLPIAIAIAISGRGISYDVDFDLLSALKSAGGGGLAGAAAMVIQVLTLMPMRTIMNYQYRYGGSIKSATTTLWNDGGFKRYYAGLAAALFQGPLSRFGDTAANAGILALLSAFTWPVLVKTIAASVASATFRMTLTPIDTIKTTQQTQGGVAGLKLVRNRIKEQGVASLWYGALATAAATFVGHYPWFGTYNWLSAVLPPPHTIIQKLLRQAFIGFAASVVSDTASNSLRVVKTYRQVHEGDVGYLTAAKEIVANEGLLGLFGRGLPTRLITNGLQGLLFSILWRYFQDLIAGKGK